MKVAANVYQGTKRVATISRTDSGYRLARLPGAELTSGRLATTLPASVFPLEASELHPYFLNLLPEGARLQLLLDTARASDDTLDLLLRVGWDAVGDVAIIAPGTSLEREPPAKVDDPSLVTFQELFERSALHDSAIAGSQGAGTDRAVAHDSGTLGTSKGPVTMQTAADQHRAAAGVAVGTDARLVQLDRSALHMNRAANLTGAGWVKEDDGWVRYDGDKKLYSLEDMQVEITDMTIRIDATFAMPLPWEIGDIGYVRIPMRIRTSILYVDEN